MVRFILKRLFFIIVVAFMVSVFIFILFRSMPIDPVDIFLPPEQAAGMMPEELALRRAEIIETMGLDRSNFVQYWHWLFQSIQGNFGISMETRQPVLDHISSPMLNTVIINIMNLFIVFLITIPVGIRAAIKRGKLFDNSALVASIVGISIPNFLFGLILIVMLAVIFPIFPMFGMASSMPPEAGTMAWYLDRLRFMILPLTTMVLTGMAGMIRYVRSAMIDALNMDCVRTARAKGLGEKIVIYSHAFRNALIPIITVMTGWFIAIFSGSMIIEITFAWRGMGQIMLSALQLQDIAVSMTVTVFYALVAFVGLLVMDLTYAIVDPRIRFE